MNNELKEFMDIELLETINNLPINTHGVILKIIDKDNYLIGFEEDKCVLAANQIKLHEHYYDKIWQMINRTYTGTHNRIIQKYTCWGTYVN